MRVTFNYPPEVLRTAITLRKRLGSWRVVVEKYGERAVDKDREDDTNDLQTGP